RLQLLLGAADGAGRQDRGDTEQLHPEDVRAEVQLGRADAMADAMAREKRPPTPAERRQHKWTGRITKRRLQRHLFAVGQSGHVVQPAAADDPYLRAHSCTSKAL